MKLKIGQKVKVSVGAPVDADVVAGRIGTVTAIDGANNMLVRFSRWTKGHGEGKHSWYVNPKYLTRVKVSRHA